MSLRDYLKNACEEIDAGVFSGDLLFQDAEREELKDFIRRWSRAITAHELDAAAELQENSQSDGHLNDQPLTPV